MRRKAVLLLLLVCLMSVSVLAIAENGRGEEKDSIEEIQTYASESMENSEYRDNGPSEEDLMINDLLKDEEDIQYYAYLDLETADPDLAPVIIKARDIIIFRQSWVADGVRGFVYDRNGNVIEEVPQFSELFQDLVLVAEYLDHLLSVHHFLDISVDDTQSFLLAAKIEGGLDGYL